jgi:hypothetical protein
MAVSEPTRYRRLKSERNGPYSKMAGTWPTIHITLRYAPALAADGRA